MSLFWPARPNSGAAAAVQRFALSLAVAMSLPSERGPAPVIRLTPRDDIGGGPNSSSIIDELYRKHARYLAGVVFRVLGNSDDVDDVLQEVFCVAMQKLDELTRVDELRGWLATVAARAAAKRLRRRKLLRALGFQDDPDYENVASRNAAFEDRVELKRLYRALDRLPVRQRLAWATRYLENEPMEEVARRCGSSMSTAKRDVTSAHARLAKELGYG
jgi:RNA polymerase sigma-70 factor (ECF subfamily)